MFEKSHWKRDTIGTIVGLTLFCLIEQLPWSPEITIAIIGFFVLCGPALWRLSQNDTNS